MVPVHEPAQFLPAPGLEGLGPGPGEGADAAEDRVVALRRLAPGPRHVGHDLRGAVPAARVPHHQEAPDARCRQEARGLAALEEDRPAQGDDRVIDAAGVAVVQLLHLVD